jgi:fructose-1,6-bisphosphatase-3
MQFKVEGKILARNPQWELDHRRLLHRIDYQAGTITIDGTTYPLRDTHLPTINPDDPYALTPDEQICLDRLKHSFRSSQKLAEHMRFIVGHGSMYLLRDDHLIFHGCVPCDAEGNFLPLTIDGKPVAGRAMFDAIETVVHRAQEQKSPEKQCCADLDLLWYLWSGPRSPLFGKDRIATLERDFIADTKPHHESKDPYFGLIHEAWFCDKVLAEFGAGSPNGLIVNGHVPVKIEKGESPMKRSGKAITIDGAFSEAYGDHGFTLVLEADRTLLVKHHHFESVEAALRDGVDIIPSVTVIRTWEKPHRIGDTERGAELRCQIDMLQRLIDAYHSNRLRPAWAIKN